MKGADELQLIGNLMAQPSFQKQFGQPVGDGTYQVPAAWQSACNYASTIGAFVGILICGQVQPIFGYKKCTLVSLVVVTGFIFITFFASTLPVLFAGEFLLGLPFGFYNAIAQAYASEIAPTPLRGMFTMYNQMCWSTGQLLAAGILYVFSENSTKVRRKTKHTGERRLTNSGPTRSPLRSNGSGQSQSSSCCALPPNLLGGWLVGASWTKQP